MKTIVRIAALVAVAAGVSAADISAQQFSLSSPDFEPNATIDMRNSAYGDNISPVLNWSGAPSGTQSYAMVLHDPDAPMDGGFVHWVIYNIPGSATGLPGGLGGDEVLTAPEAIAGTTQGLSGLRRTSYFGPRPPSGSGVHHYNFQLYALDLEPELAAGLNSETLMEAIDGHVLAETTLVGIYQVK